MSTDINQRLMDDVARHGWHCVQVMEDKQGPGYSYTVGLYKTHGHPELVVIGLPPEVAHPVLGMAVDQIAKGHVFRADARDSSLLEGNDCLIRSVLPGSYRQYLGMAVWFYRESPASFPALQILWPDPEGRFPGQPEFSMGPNQPLL